jgi:hypothetical protein
LIAPATAALFIPTTVWSATDPGGSTNKIALFANAVENSGVVNRKDARAEAETLRWLEQGRGGYGEPKLVVKRFAAVGGLLATYQATNGKRIAFKANWRSDDTVRAEIVHLSAKSKRVEPLLARSRGGAQNLGKASVLRLADFDVVSELNRGVFARKGPTNQYDEVARFMSSEEGGAFSEAVYALFVELDDVDESSRKLSDLYSMYGALLMALQLSSDSRMGFDQAEPAVPAAKAKAARALCVGLSCKAAGRRFVVHPDGLFDFLSKVKDIKPPKKAAESETSLASVVPNASNPLRDFRKNGDGNCTDPGGCFGMCGWDCYFTPGNISTPQCLGHDLCVCKWGHLACMFSVPTSGGGCDQCNTLVDAIGSFISAFFSLFGSDPPEDPFDFPDDQNLFMGW